jgi:hypothetical protein
VSAPLATREVARLAELEGVIERGLQTFIEVGRALLEIRDSRLYRENYSTFEAYCRERWGMSRAHAYRQIEAAQVAEMMSPIGDIPNEAQARALAPLKDDEETLIKVWRLANVETGGNVTAAVLSRLTEAVRRARAAQRIVDGKEWLDLFGLRPPPPRSRGGWKCQAAPPLPLSKIPAALAAHDRAQETSDTIKLVMGPWAADGSLPERRRVPENATVIEWRRRLAEETARRPDALGAIIGQIERLRANLPAESAGYLELTGAIDALRRAAREGL